MKLWEAAEEGNLSEVKRLISEGVDIHAFKNYALRTAAHNGHLQTVKLLISHGADHTVNNYLAAQWAEERGHQETAKYLDSLDIETIQKGKGKSDYRL